MFKYILFTLPVLYFVYDRLTRKYLNPYKLYFLFGAKGSGKTLTETKLCYKYLKKGWNVYTDMPELMLPGVRYFETSQLGKFVPTENSLLILGEVGTKWDKRNFKDFPVELRDFFVFQRKYKVVCYMDSQSYDVDKKVRDRCDGLFLCQRYLRVFSVAKRIILKPQIISASEDSPARIADNLVIGLPSSWMFTFIPRWVGLYDTDYVIDKKPELPYVPVDVSATKSRHAQRMQRSLSKSIARHNKTRKAHRHSLLHRFHLKNTKKRGALHRINGLWPLIGGRLVPCHARNHHQADKPLDP